MIISVRGPRGFSLFLLFFSFFLRGTREGEPTSLERGREREKREFPKCSFQEFFFIVFAEHGIKKKTFFCWGGEDSVNLLSVSVEASFSRPAFLVRSNTELGDKERNG